MCNLGQGLLERGISQGIVEGEARGEARGREAGIAEGETRERAKMILKLYQLDYSIEAIAEITELSEEQVKEILDIQ